MPVKRRKIVVKRKRGDDLVLHPETIVTILGRMRTGSGSKRRVYSSSGVLYNSSSFFPLSSTRSAVTTTSTPRFHEAPSPLFDPTRFRPPSPPRAPSRRQWVSSGIGNKLCSAESARKITGRLEIRACRARRQRRRGKVVGKVFCSMSFFFLSTEVRGFRVNSRAHLAISIPTLTSADFSAGSIRTFVK